MVRVTQGPADPDVEVAVVRKLGGVVGTIALVVTLFVAPPSRAASSDELPPSQDNGGDGRADSLNAPDVPPKVACNKPPKKPGGSQIVRRLPKGPMRPDDPTQLAFMSGVCIYLPPGYGDSQLRYPVLYLLHGGGGDQADWLNFGSLQETADAQAAAHHPMIVVMPDGDNGVWYDSPRIEPTAPDAFVLNETYVIHYVIPFVDRHYRTIADRRGRVISGLSNGGLGAFVFSAKHPDLFVAASSMSGNLGGYAHDYDQLNRPKYHDGNTPTPLAENLEGIDLIQFWGGQPCTNDAAEDLCLSWGFEQAFRYDNQLFHDTITKLGYHDQYEEREGSHAWRWWTAWLRDDHLPFLLARVAAAERLGPARRTTPPPASWHHKSISPHFSLWGYDIRVKRTELDEFLSLTHVTATAMTLTGSGVVTVRTPTGKVVTVDLGDGSTKTVAT